MQVGKTTSIQYAMQPLPSRSSLDVRDKLENYLNPEASSAKSTEYGRQRSGYVDFLKDDKFRATVEDYSTMTDAYFATLSPEQKVAWAILTGPATTSRGRVSEISGQSDRIDYNIPRPSMLPPDEGVSAGYPTPFDVMRFQSGMALHESGFHQELNAGAINTLKSVDRNSDAGISDLKWADVFRARVTSLDHNYSLLRRTYEAKGMDTGEITKLYEDALGKLYDYAVERDAARKPALT